MRISLGFQVVIAIFAAIFCGFFFGPLCNIIKPVGDVYVMFLQMAVLPYICLSLIHGLGSMTPQIGRKLFLRGWPFWALLWTLIFAMIYLLSFLIPKPILTFIGNGSFTNSSNLSKNFFTYIRTRYFFTCHILMIYGFIMPVHAFP